MRCISLAFAYFAAYSITSVSYLPNRKMYAAVYKSQNAVLQDKPRLLKLESKTCQLSRPMSTALVIAVPRKLASLIPRLARTAKLQSATSIYLTFSNTSVLMFYRAVNFKLKRIYNSPSCSTTVINFAAAVISRQSLRRKRSADVTNAQ